LNVSKNVGTGHFSRCVNFARAVKNKYNHIFVISNDSKKNIFNPYLKNNWKIYNLPENVDQKTDCEITSEVSNKENAKLILTDLCSNQSLENPDELIKYHLYLRKLNPPYVISIEDYRMEGFASNLAIIWNADRNFDSKTKKLYDCKIRLGLKYFICDPDLTEARSLNRLIHIDSKKILVFISGSDPKNISSIVAQSFNEYFNDDLSIKFIVTNMNSKENFECVKNICKKNINNFEFLEFNKKIYEHLLWADIAIVGDGLIKYEAAVLGTPVILISQFDHDNYPMKYYDSIECGIHLNKSGRISKKALYETTIELLKNYKLRRKLSINGKNSIDGQGLKRIFEVELRNII